MGVPFGYKKHLERIRRMRNATIFDFRQVHLEPVKNAVFPQSKRLIDFSTGIFNIIIIESKCTQRKLSFTDKKKSR